MKIKPILVLALTFLLVIPLVRFSHAQFFSSASRKPLKIEEEDGTPSGRTKTLKVTNATLTDNGDGSFSLNTGGSGAANITNTNGGISIAGDLTTTGDLSASADVTAANFVYIGNQVVIRDNAGGDAEFSEDKGQTWTDFGSGGAGMTSFVLEDADGTEVSISDAEEVKFIETTGLDINWTDVSTGSDADPFDLTFTIEATLQDIADGTIAEDLVNTANPWADNEVADAITVNPINATTETAIEAVVDLESLQGAVTDGQVPDNITITEADPNVDSEAEIEAITGVAFGASKVNTAGYIWVADGTDFESVAMSGDIAIASGGATTVQADSVALTTDTTGNYAAGDGEAGAATSGDAAVDFFGAGVDAVTDATTCTDIEGTGLSITAGTLNAAIEGTAVLSTGEGGGTKFLREDGDGTSSWQAASGTSQWNDHGNYLIPADSTDDVQIDADMTINGSLTVSTQANIVVNTFSKAASYTLLSQECYNTIIYVTGAATITVPAVEAGMNFSVITVGAVAVSVDFNGSDKVVLDGTTLDDGDKITNTSTTGDIAVVTYYSADGFYATTNGWTDGGA